MKEIIQQLIQQIEDDRKFSSNTKSNYKSDLNELISYVEANDIKLSSVNQTFVRNFLTYLEKVNKEKSSYNRRASTFRFFLKYLYLKNLAPTNYSLIVSNVSYYEKSKEDILTKDEINPLFDKLQLSIEKKLILFLIGKLGMSATQIASLNTYQIDFENKSINLSDTEKIFLKDDVFLLLRKYLLEIRTSQDNEGLCLFFNEKGKPLSENDIYKLIKDLSTELKLEGKLTTRNLRNTLEDKTDILSMQREVLGVTNSML